jgi:Spermine/spermidine synthase domain
MSGRPPRRVFVAVALVAGCTLGFQVVFTRVLSAVLAYHFAFLAISLGLLGTGAGALAVYLLPGWFARLPLTRMLAWWCALFAASLIAVPLVFVHLNFSTGPDRVSEHFGESVPFLLNLAAVCVLAAVPSLAAGVAIALTITGYTRWIGGVYAADLVGAGMGALLVVPLLSIVDAPTLVVVLGGVAAVAAVLFAGAAPRERLVGLGTVALSATLIVASLATSVLFVPPRYKLGSDRRQIAERWNPLSRVIGYDLTHNPRLAAVFYDRVYAAVIKVHDNSLPDWRELHLGPQSVGYTLTGSGRALVIGGGGGRDIYNALSSGAKRVDVIELNSDIRNVVDNELRSFSGSPYSRPGVHTTIGDGRAILAARSTKYDQIQLSFTDTLSATGAQGFALTENNLYTEEAFKEYLDHLRPDGVLNVSRLRRLVGDEAIRATVLVLASLQQHGVKHPERNVVVLRGDDLLGEQFGTVLAKLKPYTPEELAQIRTLAEERGDGVAFAPGGPYRDEWKQLAQAPSWQSFCRSYHLNVCPPTDDKPFFFNMQRLTQVGNQGSGYFFTTAPYTILMLTLGILAVLSAIAFVVPLGLARRERRPSPGALIYFAAIGVGFLVLEIVLIQRFVLFLGFPTYALSVVLFALLVFTGIGSQLSTRFRRARRALLTALSIAALLILGSAYALQPILRGLIELPFAARVAVAVTLLAPFGLVLGMAMPIGLRRFQGLYPESVPYAWGVNGVASVLASVLGVALAINFGFAITTVIAGLCYVGALTHAALGRWPTSEAVT